MYYGSSTMLATAVSQQDGRCFNVAYNRNTKPSTNYHTNETSAFFYLDSIAVASLRVGIAASGKRECLALSSSSGGMIIPIEYIAH